MAVEDRALPDRYTGAEPIGRGGMGEIYRATDTALGRAVAMKILGRALRAGRGRARAVHPGGPRGRAPLREPAHVTIYDVGE